MMTCVSDCKIEFSVEFPNEDDRRRKRKEVTEGTSPTYTLDVKDGDDDTRHEANMAKFIVKKPLHRKDDIIEDNIKKMSLWNRISVKERRDKSQIFKQRRNNALRKKEQLHMEKVRQNIYYMNRWDIVREKRKDIEQQERKYKSE
jgi:hypothetical protein